MLDPQAKVFCLLPAGADPHHVSFTPRQIGRLKQAELLIRASRDDGGWRNLQTIRQVLDLWPRTDHGWLQPQRVRSILPRLAERLAALAPQRRQQIYAALDQALEQCDQFDKAWRHRLSALRTSGVILQHPAWKGLCYHYGVPVLAILESHQHGRELGPHKLETSLALMRKYPDARLWGNVRHANQALNWLARHGKGRSVLLLDPLGGCGMSWPELMQANLALIQQ